MVEIYDSHEQSERVKGWLRENGSAIAIGLILAFGGLFGFKQWQIWHVNKARQASAEYQTMVKLLNDGKLDDAVANYQTLQANFSRSAYAPLAALHMAKARVDAGQGDLAVGLLEYAMQEGRPAPVQVIARERLARLKLDQGDPDGALALIDGAPTDDGFEARFAEIRGDIYLAQGKREDAIAQYKRALEQHETGIGYQPLLEMKLESLGETPPGGPES